MKKLIIKIEDWCDKVYYTVTSLSIKKFWNNLWRWICYYPVIRKTYDFDYTCMLEVERHQLTKLKNCISKYKSHVDSDYDIRNMNLAISCLNIVIENGCVESNGEQVFFEKGPDKDGYYHLIENPKHRYIMPIYVNTRNYKRFWKGYHKDTDIEPLLRDTLRIEKAWYLYCKIRKEHLREFWD